MRQFVSPRVAIALIVSLGLHTAIFFPLWYAATAVPNIEGRRNLIVTLKPHVSSKTVSADTEASMADAEVAKKLAPQVIGAAPDHVSSDQLTLAPKLLDELPEIAASTGGDVRLRLIINASGKVVYLQVLQSTVPKSIEEQLVLALYQAHYQAGRKGSIPVSAEMFIDARLE